MPAAVTCWLRRRVVHPLSGIVGGPARLRVVLLLSAVLGLNSADTGTIGAVAGPLEHDLGIGATRLGLLAGVAAAAGAVGAVPAGILADRVRRVPVLALTIVVWGAAMVSSGLAPSYGWLMVSRLALGAAMGASGPVVASLVGDLFRPEERARAYGWILSGEIVGAGVGLVLGGDVAALASWRAAFFLLAAGSLGLAWWLWRALPEPARGGDSWLPVGAHDIPLPDNDQEPARAGSGDRADAVRDLAEKQGVRPVPARVLHAPPSRMPVWRSVRYLLAIPSNRLLILASAIGYFFFAGLRTFAVVFVEHRYHLPAAAVSGLLPVIGLGALAGVVFGGRLTDRVLRHGILTARIITPTVGYVAAVVFFVPALLASGIAVALPLFVLAAAGLASANPPLDAARLDIVPGGMWGRAESIRTLLRLGAEAVAPAVFGFVTDLFASSSASASGLRDAFLLMLVPLLANGLIVWHCRGRYPADVATAAASDDARARGAAG